jgi:hypothetical protein
MLAKAVAVSREVIVSRAATSSSQVVYNSYTVGSDSDVLVPRPDNAIVVVDPPGLGTESLERPELVQLPDGGWRLYLSCATTGTRHWRVEVTDAAHPAEFDVRQRSVVLPGDPLKRAVQDPVITYRGDQWHMWATIHPLADPDATDQMTTEYATSTDGLDWTWQGTALCGRPGEWDSRGTRVTAVRFGAGLAANAATNRATNAYQHITVAAAVAASSRRPPGQTSAEAGRRGVFGRGPSRAEIAGGLLQQHDGIVRSVAMPACGRLLEG